MKEIEEIGGYVDATPIDLNEVRQQVPRSEAVGVRLRTTGTCASGPGSGSGRAGTPPRSEELARTEGRP